MKTKTESQLRAEMASTPAGQLLSRMGLEYYDTESSARRVAEHAAEELEVLRVALDELLDYMGGHDLTAKDHPIVKARKALEAK